MKANTLLLLLLFVFGLSSIQLLGCGRGGEPGQEDNQQESGVSVAITSPEDGSFQNRGRIRVRGTAVGINQVEVNGATVSVVGGNWDHLLNFEEGENSVEVVAGEARAQVEFFVDSIKPSLRVDGPQRGAFIDSSEGPTVRIHGEVADEGSGIFMVQVNGNIIDHDEETGAFSYDLPVRQGVNVFSLDVFDRAENRRKRWQALIYGPLVDPVEEIERALTVDITPGGVNDLTEVVLAYLTPERVLGFLETGFEGAELMITDLEWESLGLNITPRNGFLEVELEITGFRLGGIYQPEGGEPNEGTIEVAELAVTQEIALSVGDENELQVEVLRSTVDLDNNDIGGSLVAGSSLLRSLVAGAIAYAFTEFFSELIEGNLYDPEVLIREFEFLDRTIEVALQLEEILISPLGISVELGLAFPAMAYPQVAAHPGALYREPGPNTGTSITTPFRLHSTRSALDRVLHSLWRAGLFHQTFGGDDLDFQLPFSLTADGLASLLDQRIRDLYEPDTPVEFGLRPLLPPVMEFGSTLGDNSLQIDFSELLIDIFLRPAGEAPVLVVSVALYLEIDVEVKFDGFQVGLDIDLEAEGAVVDEPLFEVDQDRTVNLITTLLNLIPNLVDTQFTIDGASNFEWAKISDTEIEVNGSSRDRTTFGLRITPAEDFIGDDEVSED